MNHYLWLIKPLTQAVSKAAVLALAIATVGMQPAYSVENVFTDVLNMSSKKITNVTNPTAAQDAATKAYVDAQISSGGGDTDWVESGANVYRTSGNVGIGTTSPDRALQVLGDIMVGETNTVGGNLYLYGTTAGKYSRLTTTNGNLHIDSGYGSGGGSELYLNWYSGGKLHYGGGAGADKFSVTAAGVGYFSGNVGIGTTSPAQKLHVNGNIRADGRYVYLGASQYLYGDNGVYLYYNSNDSSTTAIRLRDKESTNYGYLYGSGNGARFGLLDGDGNWSYEAVKDNYTAFKINNSEKMRIATSGNVGIGTTAASEKLQVDGNIYTPNGSYGSIDSGTVYVANPAGAAYNGNSNLIGAIKITLPQSWTNTMMKMTVEIYDYSTDESVTVKLGGYNYSGASWPNTFAQIIASKADRDYKVRFGHDGTKNAIWIGETTSTWSYLKVRVVDFIGTHSNATFDRWDDNWDVTLVTAFGTVSTTQSSNLVAANVDAISDSLWAGNGTNIYRSSGNVGIGNTSPSQKLHVTGDSLLAGKVYVGSTDSYFYRDAANRIATPDSFYVQATSPATYLYSTNTYLGNTSGDTIHLRGNNFAWNQGVIKGNGNVGIGTTSPSQKLEVNGNLRLSPSNPTIYSGGSYINVPSGLYVSGGTTYLQNTAMMRNGIQNDSSSDSGYLRVKDSLLADSWLRTSGATGWLSQSYGGGIYMTDSTWIRTYGSKGFYHNAGIMRTDGTFHVGGSGSRFIVNTSGNVGIGDTSPDAKLDVNGTIRAPEICDENGANCKDISSGWGSVGGQWDTGTVTGGVSSSWYNAAWSHRKQITVKASMTPNTTQSSFPLIVKRSSDSNLASRAQSDGGDILFTSSNGTSKLLHEIEIYTSGSGELVAWVNIPSLSSSADTIIYMYYGNSSVANQANDQGTWNSGYKAVWHFKEDPGIDTDGHCGSFVLFGNCDSTSNNNDIDEHSMDTSSWKTGGPTGKSVYFDGGSDWYETKSAYTNGLSISGNKITMEAWAKPDTSHAVDTPFIMRGGSDNDEKYFLGIDGASADAINTRITTSSHSTYNDNPVFSNNVWAHIVSVYDGAYVRVYKNGVQVAAHAKTGNLSTTTSDTRIALRKNGGRFYKGELDELRISDVARSADWVKAEYNNQANHNTYVAFGAETIPTPAGPIDVYTTPSNIGRVGIGTTQPQAELDVAGRIFATELCDESGANCQDLSSGGGNGGDYLPSESYEASTGLPFFKAVESCRDSSQNGQRDWHLPSLFEAEYLDSIGQFGSSSGDHWTTTPREDQSSGTSREYKSYRPSTDYRNDHNISSSYYVRCVR